MPKNRVFEHYRKEEQPFVEKVIDWANRVETTHIPFLTDFIDPRQKEIIKNIVNGHMNLTMFFDGGYTEAERGKVLISPDYFMADIDQMELSFFEITDTNKFKKLTHQDYMGALLNIGLKREKFGDILLSENRCQFIVAREISDFVRMQLKQISNTKIELREIKREDLVVPNQLLTETNSTVSSLRLDNMLSQMTQHARSKTVDWIKKGYVKVNWQIVEKSDFLLNPGDMVSVRGFGRFKFLEQEGFTKKGRFRVKLGKYQ